MNNEHRSKSPTEETPFSQQVRVQAERKIKARRNATKSIWFGLGMSGLIGWTITVPTLIGIGVGIWIDRRFPSAYSWTLMLMMIGLVIGCLNAWHWIESELNEMKEDPDV